MLFQAMVSSTRHVPHQDLEMVAAPYMGARIENMCVCVYV